MKCSNSKFDEDFEKLQKNLEGEAHEPDPLMELAEEAKEEPMALQEKADCLAESLIHVSAQRVAGKHFEGDVFKTAKKNLSQEG